MAPSSAALVLVDLQNDFLPTGALPVPEGDQVIPVANALIPIFERVVATQDWHPADHGSFAANHLWRKPGQVIELNGLSQVLWPMHCVQDSYGAEFVRKLHTDRIDRVFRKGTDPGIDSYSGFFDNGHRKSTGLADYLKEYRITDLFVLGLATDYCVKFTVLDGVQLGFNTYVITDGCRGVNLIEGDAEEAFKAMQAVGAQLIQSDRVPQLLTDLSDGNP